MTDVTTTQPKPTNCYAYPRASYILTDEDWQTILQHLQDGYTMAGAAKAVGATRQAIYDHCNRDPSFAQAVQHCTREGTDFYVDLMRTKALDPRTGFLANIAILKHRDPAGWSDRTITDINVHGSINIYHIAEAVERLERGELVEIGQDAVRELGEP